MLLHCKPARRGRLRQRGRGNLGAFPVWAIPIAQQFGAQLVGKVLGGAAPPPPPPPCTFWQKLSRFFGGSPFCS